VFSCGDIIEVALRAISSIGEVGFSFVIMCAYNLAILVWLRYMWAKQTARESPVTLLTSQRWDQSLADLQRPASADSLIPMFEGMVERAFSRTNDETALPDAAAAEFARHRADSPEAHAASSSFIERLLSKP
jgi:hypothetical protein